jgi:type VI protein secretion system component VasA
VTLTVLKTGKTVLIPDVLVDDGYTETICIQPAFAKELEVYKCRKPASKLKLGNGQIVDDYKYAVGRKKEEVVVCEVEFTEAGATTEKKRKKKTTSSCAFKDVFYDASDNILGCKALAQLGVLVDCTNKHLRKALRAKY